MKIGTHVCLVGTDGFMPPIGTCGVIVGRDDDGEYMVEFPEYPCPAAPGTWWFALPEWLIPLDTYVVETTVSQEAHA